MSTHQATNEKIVGIIAKIIRANPEELVPSSAMGEVEHWDSLAQLSILSALEQEFRIEIEPEVAVDLTSVERICSFISKA